MRKQITDWKAERDPALLDLAENPFVAPESLSQLGAGAEGEYDGLAAADEMVPSSAWDVAVRYHEFKSMAQLRSRIPWIRRLSARAILAQARAVLGSVVQPTRTRIVSLDALPPHARDAELELEETIESTPGLDVQGPQDLYVEYREPRSHSVVLVVDTSLSMTGEKLALTAVALAVVLLQFPEDPVGIVAFENESQVLKRFDERIGIPELVERFLDVQAQGYTHLEEGLQGALRLIREAGGGHAARGRSRPPSTVLMTDGKYTAGRDPAYLASRFDHLNVIKMGRERAGMALCQEMARRGNGTLKEVEQLEALPGATYSVIKDLLRGRSI